MSKFMLSEDSVKEAEMEKKHSTLDLDTSREYCLGVVFLVLRAAGSAAGESVGHGEGSACYLRKRKQSGIIHRACVMMMEV